ncbi:MAG: DUF4230 domain-containing protein [Planctomycetaceae bacterium]|nr:DUF4230 domain-containing protein [Planctomycetaceae bacterium]
MSESESSLSRTVRPLLLVILGGLALWAAFKFQALVATLGTRTDIEVTLAVLKSKPVMRLVTREISTQVVIEDSETNIFFDRRAVIWAKVEICAGVDLESIGDQDIRRQGDTLFIRLPQPRVISMSVGPDIHCLTKATSVARMQDLFNDQEHRRRMEQRLHNDALQLARQVMPSRQEIVDQLNAAAASFQQQAHCRIRFE